MIIKRNVETGFVQFIKEGDLELNHREISIFHRPRLPHCGSEASEERKILKFNGENTTGILVRKINPRKTSLQHNNN
jgi:hypothetical protein